MILPTTWYLVFRQCVPNSVDVDVDMVSFLGLFFVFKSRWTKTRTSNGCVLWCLTAHVHFFREEGLLLCGTGVRQHRDGGGELVYDSGCNSKKKVTFSMNLHTIALPCHCTLCCIFSASEVDRVAGVVVVSLDSAASLFYLSNSVSHTNNIVD